MTSTASSGMGGHTYNLRQIQRVISNGVENQILQPVDDVEQFLAQRRHGAGDMCSGYSWTGWWSLVLGQTNTQSSRAGPKASRKFVEKGGRSKWHEETMGAGACLGVGGTGRGFGTRDGVYTSVVIRFKIQGFAARANSLGINHVPFPRTRIPFPPACHDLSP